MKNSKKKKQGTQICIICKSGLTMSDTAKTCCYKCAGKLAWKTRLKY
jgi:hypothetical protein